LYCLIGTILSIRDAVEPSQILRLNLSGLRECVAAIPSFVLRHTTPLNLTEG
jgi:hypothetical protein